MWRISVCGFAGDGAGLGGNQADKTAVSDAADWRDRVGRRSDFSAQQGLMIAELITLCDWFTLRIVFIDATVYLFVLRNIVFSVGSFHVHVAFHMYFK